MGPEASMNPSGSSPTMDGNRTHEILGDIDISRLTVGEILGNGEFGSVLRGIWLSPSGDKVSAYTTDYSMESEHAEDIAIWKRKHFNKCLMYYYL